MSISRRLSRAEQVQLTKDVAELEMIADIQKQLGLPLPPGADLDEGLRRLQEAIASEQFDDFAAWVRDQHAQFNR